MPRFKAKLGWGRPPVWTNAPTTLTLPTGSTYNFAPHASDPDSAVLTFSLVNPAAGYSITSGGLMTAGAASASITVRVSDAGASADTVVAVTVPAEVLLEWTIPESTYALPNLTAGQGDEYDLSGLYTTPVGVTAVLTIVSDTSGLCSISGTKLVRPNTLTANSYTAVVSLNGSSQRTFGFTVAAVGFTYDPAFVGSVSGTLTDGGSITITGTGFTTKANAKPLLWCPLETDLQPHPTLSRVTARTPHATAAIQTTIKPTGATGAARDLATTGSARLYSDDPIWDTGATGETYVFVKRYYGHARAENLKMFRYWTTTGQYHNLLQSASEGGRGFYIEPENGANADDGLTSYSSVPWNGFSWETHEYEIKHGTVDLFDGRCRYWMNGGLAMAYNKGWRTTTTAYPNTMKMGYLDQYTVNSPPSIPTDGTYYLYYHSLYVDDTRHRVFVSDEPSFNTELYGVNPVYNREICIPTAWSDTSVTVVLRKGSHASLSGKYLYVVNGNGAATKIGSFN